MFFCLLKHLSWQQEIRWVQISINIFKITNYLGEKSPFDKTSLKTGTGDLNHYRCVERFTSGCPTTPYTDDEIYTRRSIFCSRHIIQSGGIWIKSKHFPGKNTDLSTRLDFSIVNVYTSNWLSGRGHFYTVSMSFRRRAIYKNKIKYPNKKVKIYRFFLVNNRL